ncbi:DGQHR domain-containing protein [Paraburkholderia fungorum]|uniref:DGQHR domain-containing protein n=1 Tax=Paraburkholderia fungorum TaxID=134537 RepID=UPI001C1F161C|nr:DGQHR domain-containing protein [Paraburkholderia fungorum]MBU7437006.1 DGQHR domain-containing protein [Paraburkholderia fungorum]
MNNNLDTIPENGEEVRVAVSQIRQGEKRFVTFSIFSDVLAGCCFATSREEDPKVGFQRVLNERRAKDIADYIDSDLGTIPSSIVLSAQDAADFKLVSRGKIASFLYTPHSFLILDGQHRVYGYSLARTRLRVPVVVYEGLKPEEEARLFIDINTKQKPVPRELLLAINRLARRDSDTEAVLAEIFDYFDEDGQSALLGLTSTAKKQAGKISRVTFNAGLKPHLPVFASREPHEIYSIWNGYLHGLRVTLGENYLKYVVATNVFRAICDVFPECLQRVVDRFGRKYKTDHFAQVTAPFASIKPAAFKKEASTLADDLRKALKSSLSA